MSQHSEGANSVAGMIVAVALGAILFVFPANSRAGCILPSDDALFDGQFSNDFGSSVAVDVIEHSNPQPVGSPLNLALPQKKLNPAQAGGSQGCTGSPSEPTSGGGSVPAAMTDTQFFPAADLTGRQPSAAALVLPSPPLDEILDPPKRID